MGWMGISMDRKPDSQELTRIITERMERNGYTIIDRSGWLDRDSRIFLLMEHERDGHNGEKPQVVRFIAVVRMEYHRGELLIREDDESVGPNDIDCPMRIMNQMEGHPPVNEYSRKWRERVLTRHADMRPRKAALRRLRKEYPDGAGVLVLKTGEQVNYAQGKYRGQRNTSAYIDPKNGRLNILRPQMINPEATAALRQRAPGAEGPEASGRADEIGDRVSAFSRRRPGTPDMAPPQDQPGLRPGGTEHPAPSMTGIKPTDDLTGNSIFKNGPARPAEKKTTGRPRREEEKT